MSSEVFKLAVAQQLRDCTLPQLKSMLEEYAKLRDDVASIVEAINIMVQERSPRA